MLPVISNSIEKIDVVSDTEWEDILVVVSDKLVSVFSGSSVVEASFYNSVD